jgi:hypothetical protein
MMAMILASLDEVVDKRLVVEKAARDLAKKLRTPTLLPYMEGPCSMTRPRQL